MSLMHPFIRLKLRARTLVFIILAGLMWPSASLAYLGLCCAHCGGNMPLNIPGAGIPEPHEFRFKISQDVMQMGPMRSGTTDLTEGSVLASGYMTVPSAMQMYMTMFSGAYSFNDNFALMAMTSFKFNRMQMEFGSALKTTTGQSGFTMESGGLGDLKLLGKYRLFSDDHLSPTVSISALLGVSLPTGNMNKTFTRHPVANQNGTLLPYKMQLGSGTVDPMVGLAYQGSHDPFWYGATALYTGRFYDNNEGYQQGDEVRVDVYGMYQWHAKSVVHLQLNGSWEDQYSDEPDSGKTLGHGHMNFNPAMPFVSPLFDPDNYGGTKLKLTAGIQWQPFPMNIIELNGSIPVYQNLHGPQLEDDYQVMLTWYIEIPTKHSRRHTGIQPPKELGF